MFLLNTSFQLLRRESGVWTRSLLSDWRQYFFYFRLKRLFKSQQKRSTIEEDPSGSTEDSFKSARISLDESFLWAPWAFAMWLGRTPACPASAWMKTRLPWRRSQRISGARSPLNPVFIWAHWQVLLRVQRKEKKKWKHRALSQHWFKSILWACQEKEGHERDRHPLVCRKEKRSRGETSNDVLTAGPLIQLEHALNTYYTHCGYWK